MGKRCGDIPRPAPSALRTGADTFEWHAARWPLALYVTGAEANAALMIPMAPGLLAIAALPVTVALLWDRPRLMCVVALAGCALPMGAIKELCAAFPDNTLVIEQTVVGADRVTVELTQHATSRGLYEGASPTGQRVTIPAIHILRVSKARISEW